MADLDKNILLFLFVMICTSGWAQSEITGFIYDKGTNAPLPYCTIRVDGSNTDHTITNEDGKFRINNVHAQDSLEIRHLGYKTLKWPVSAFKNESVIYLEMDVSTLGEVVLTAKQDVEYPYKLLYDVIEKYRKKVAPVKSKAYLTLTSSARRVPIEHLEGLYNSEQSLSGGILDLKIKSGRFGQNKKFTYYSLDNTKIVSDFQFFGTANQILPKYPGNMNYESLKRKYEIKIDACPSCANQEVMVSFLPKNLNGRLFSGTMLLDYEQLVIKKVQLSIKDPKTKELASINENIKLTPKEAHLDVVFNPIDFEKILLVDFTFSMDYKFDNVSETIDSRTFLYLYDYDEPFQDPFFTKKISFNNDYDKIIALHASNSFWEANYQFPKSLKDLRSLDFLKKNGYLINYDSSIPLRDLKYVSPSVYAWQKASRFRWEYLESSSVSEVSSTQNGKRDITVGKAFDTPFEAHRDASKQRKKSELDVSYVIDRFENKEGEMTTVSRTILDLGSSQFGSQRTKDKLVFINMVFDIYEVYRRLAAFRIRNEMSFDQVKAVYDEIYQGASIEVKKMEKETIRGTDQEALVKWNDRIKNKLGVDNLKPDY